MSRSAKLALVLSLSLLAVMGLAAGLVYASVCRSGVIGIEVQDRTGGGRSFSLEIPATVVTTLSGLFPATMDDEELAEIREDFPAAAGFLEALEACPDGPFVLVEKAGERVEIAKRGSNLVILIEQPRKAVRITSPLAIFRTFLESLDSPAESPVV